MKINATIFRSIFVFALLGFFALPAVGHEVGLYQDEGLTVNQVESSGAEYMTLYLGLHWDPSVDPVANGILVKGFTGRIRCEGPVVLVSAQFDSFIGNAEALPDLLIYGDPWISRMGIPESCAGFCSRSREATPPGSIWNP
jgi:hypothetical protein